MAARLPHIPAWSLLSLLVLVLAACGKGDGAPQQGAGGGMPPPEVGVVRVATGDIGIVRELPGRLEASRVAQVRAQATGIVLKREFREGSDVRAGQLLFRIDPGPYAAQVASAQANVAKAQAAFAKANALEQRYRPLVEANAISKQEYADAVAAEKQAEADVAAARAALRAAEINMGYTTVNAPISGRIGRALVTEGALVSQAEATQLAVIQQINPLYINFTQSATEVTELRRALQEGRLKRAGSEGAQVRVQLEDGSLHPQPGRLLFADLTVDQNTGQVTLRAEVPNPAGMLLPGMYVRVQIEQAKAGNALLLPQQAVTRSPQGDTVMVVDANGNVSQRTIRIGGAQDSKWVVLGGLAAGEQVMVDGFQKLRPGAPVKPVPWGASSGPAGTAAVPASAPASAAAPAASAASAPASAASQAKKG
ncbi:efflux RND transporter periplasmic adaptor subunit [Ramlibacter sp. USB13]|uniref:Efflux RND transporter periplasmic adaptor subunit n=1 Tax=Ramlibacter cellulosilyticus TaxID=2764187 RepID=A0A923MLL2_9BURK|nr:efflux RND transporter periplasmic adaptor subunit [Ramlibacter cellulosilyticus]MBC5781892.1 efflux RND transporter periplasmic adaptor subunit [Ramlibacter cellulosilyticus]